VLTPVLAGLAVFYPMWWFAVRTYWLADRQRGCEWGRWAYGLILLGGPVVVVGLKLFVILVVVGYWAGNLLFVKQEG